MLDAGQCNDSYSLAVIALKLKEVFELNDINELPIAYNIAWYEQKAVIVLLALLSLGVKNIHLGPTLPAFLSPNVASVLVESFGIAGIGTVDEDMKLLIGEGGYYLRAGAGVHGPLAEAGVNERSRGIYRRLYPNNLDISVAKP